MVLTTTTAFRLSIHQNPILPHQILVGSPEKSKISLFNLRHSVSHFRLFSKKNHSGVIDLISGHRPDVLGLQEVYLHQIFDILEALKNRRNSDHSFPSYGWVGLCTDFPRSFFYNTNTLTKNFQFTESVASEDVLSSVINSDSEEGSTFLSKNPKIKILSKNLNCQIFKFFFKKITENAVENEIDSAASQTDPLKKIFLINIEKQKYAFSQEECEKSEFFVRLMKQKAFANTDEFVKPKYDKEFMDFSLRCGEFVPILFNTDKIQKLNSGFLFFSFTFFFRIFDKICKNRNFLAEH